LIQRIVHAEATSDERDRIELAYSRYFYADLKMDPSRTRLLAVREHGGGQSTVSYAELLARFRELAAAADPS